MSNTRTLPHAAESLGGVSKPSQHGSDRPLATQHSTHRLSQWVSCARPVALIGRENGQKVTLSAAMRATQDDCKPRPCTYNQSSYHLGTHNHSWSHYHVHPPWTWLELTKLWVESEKLG